MTPSFKLNTGSYIPAVGIGLVLHYPSRLVLTFVSDVGWDGLVKVTMLPTWSTWHWTSDIAISTL